MAYKYCMVDEYCMKDKDHVEKGDLKHEAWRYVACPKCGSMTDMHRKKCPDIGTFDENEHGRINNVVKIEYSRANHPPPGFIPIGISDERNVNG